jgi:hypothetical protein
LNHHVPGALYQLHFTYFTTDAVDRMIDIDESLAGTPFNHCEYEFVKTSLYIGSWWGRGIWNWLQIALLFYSFSLKRGDLSK